MGSANANSGFSLRPALRAREKQVFEESLTRQSQHKRSWGNEWEGWANRDSPACANSHSPSSPCYVSAEQEDTVNRPQCGPGSLRKSGSLLHPPATLSSQVLKGLRYQHALSARLEAGGETGKM